MFDTEKFVEIANKKAIINKLQKEVNEVEIELRTTFPDDVAEFFLSKGYELVNSSKYTTKDKKFLNLRQLNKQNIFDPGCEPKFAIAGRNNLIVRFEWSLVKNTCSTQIYWYPWKQTLEDFFNRRLKKVLILSIKVERKNKLNMIISNQEYEKE